MNCLFRRFPGVSAETEGFPSHDISERNLLSGNKTIRGSNYRDGEDFKSPKSGVFAAAEYSRFYSTKLISSTLRKFFSGIFTSKFNDVFIEGTFATIKKKTDARDKYNSKIVARQEKSGICVRANFQRFSFLSTTTWQRQVGSIRWWSIILSGSLARERTVAATSAWLRVSPTRVADRDEGTGRTET